MDFLVQNHVEFAIDHNDNTYVATIKIVNKVKQPEAFPEGENFLRDGSPDVINGRD
jgi:hypothetical protein